MTHIHTVPTHTKRCTYTDGFTLVEMMIAVALFSVVMTICVGSLLSLVDASRKAQALQSVMSNLNSTIDGMVRSLRMGSNYRVVSQTELSFTPYGADPNDDSKRWVYKWEDTDGDLNPDRITKRYTPKGFSNPVTVNMTGSDVEISYVRFYVEGESTLDLTQPRVLIIIRGLAGAEKQKTKTEFNIQASATQRILDI
jgi:prepilin-type N-terminal cleavage/methylation domain-containing protein